MPSTQQFLQFDHVREGIIVTKNADVRAILKIFPVNFSLKSQEEQDALTYAFQNFLNSLDFDLQIVLHSQKMNIDPYLNDLRVRADQQENDLLRAQTEEYIEFVQSFVQTTNIMTKEFYLVVPFALFHAEHKEGGLVKGLRVLVPQPSRVIHMTDTQFSAARTQLMQRIDFIVQNLAQMGLVTRLMETEEVVHLFWRLYNPEQQASGVFPQIPEEALRAPANQ